MLAGYERGFRRAKEGDRCGNLGRMGEPAHTGRPPGRRAAHVLEKLRVGPPRLAKSRRRRVAGAVRLGLDAAGRDTVDGDPMAYDLACERRRQPDHRAFADPSEQRVVGRPGAPSLAADVDDTAVLPLNHVRQYRLAAAQRAPDVPPHRLLHQLLGEIDQLQADQGRRVVDQRVDVAEIVERAAHHIVGDARFAEVPDKRQNALIGPLLQLTCRALQALVLNVAGDDVGAFLGEPLGDDPPKSLRRPGDDRDAALVAAAMGRLRERQRRQFRRLGHGRSSRNHGNRCSDR
jgi:hypothetical protein